MLTIDPKKVSVPELHSYLLGAIAPRPIAFASTVDKDGKVNLSPYSFFNCFGANPPIVIFSPARRGRDNTTKHTYENVKEVKEVVINVVNYAIVEQMSLSSTEYPKGVNEFEKAGLTEAKSVLVKPPRVKEAPVAFECKVLEVKETGTEGGAGNLVICEVLLAHFNDDILDENKKVDPFKLDAVARMGGNYYCRAQGDAIFEIPKPLKSMGIGVDSMPEEVRSSHVLTGNNLGRLGNVEKLPDQSEVEAFVKGSDIIKIAKDDQYINNLHKLAQTYVEKGDLDTAWKILLSSQ
ncbi:flavin reductase family protein [Fulvivirga sp. RKSG066]|uniref:flavin reductase family protein n=1 Tax=Fulvivirga aurantia TaxID=2529383 RepID=UPI0012BCB526|nr:flavin reductase family protein [Fulvivirga aurantia]MTI20196.1 flavin reductase family protein [Fulvivirga aurantia]